MEWLEKKYQYFFYFFGAAVESDGAFKPSFFITNGPISFAGGITINASFGIM